MHPSLSQESLRYLRHPGVPGVELLVAEPSLHSWRMFHERYLIGGFLSVSTSWVYRRRFCDMEDKRTGFMEPGEVHKVVAKRKPSHFLALFIEPEVFQDFANEHGIAGVPHFAATDTTNPRLLRHLQEFAACLKNGRDTLKLEFHLAAVMHESLHYAEVRPRPPINRIVGPGLVRSLETVREMLHERYNETIRLEELASASALSSYHLARTFTAHYGLPPHAYQVQMRIKHACRMLRSGLTCAATASAAGFADQSHLARHFKSIMGVTPRQYAKTRD